MIRSEHWYLFAVDFNAKMKLCLNSIECKANFEQFYRPVGDVVIAYFSCWYSVCGQFAATDFDKFEWSIPSIPVQPDSASCGLFLCWVLENWVGYIPQNFFQKWAKKEAILQGRRMLVARLLTQKENKKLGVIKDEVEAWTKQKTLWKNYTGT